jgi:hypothetical protein
MGVLGRLYRAFNAFTGRSKIGALQGGLIFNLKNSGVDSPRAQQFISQIASAAWNIPLISGFFQSLGFSFDDYAVMYHAAVRACPDMLIGKKNLIATFLLIDNPYNLEQGLRAYNQSVSGQIGNERAQGLAMLITSMVSDVVRYKETELSSIDR